MTYRPTIPVDLLPPDYRRAVTAARMTVSYDDGEYIVPAGFETDFASIPRFFWRIWPPWGPWTPAAIMHDRLYTTHACSRREADRRFREAIKVHYRVSQPEYQEPNKKSGLIHRRLPRAYHTWQVRHHFACGFITRWTFWAGVRLGGGSHWNKPKEDRT